MFVLAGCVSRGFEACGACFGNSYYVVYSHGDVPTLIASAPGQASYRLSREGRALLRSRAESGQAQKGGDLAMCSHCDGTGNANN